MLRCNPSAIVPKSPLNSSHSIQWALEQDVEPSEIEVDFPKNLDAALPFSKPLTSTQALEDPQYKYCGHPPEKKEFNNLR